MDDSSKTFTPRLPPHLKRRYRPGGAVARVEKLLASRGLHTVCQSAHCPNQGECFGHGTATFLILGNTCTRNCRFCAITANPDPPAPDPREPARILEAVRLLGLHYVVITSVTRDDLALGGAEQFAACIRILRENVPDIQIEVLTPDFRGNGKALDFVLAEGPDVFNHNIETVPSLYPAVRPQADYAQSLAVLRHAAQYAARHALPCKSDLSDASDLSDQSASSGKSITGTSSSCASRPASPSLLTKSGLMVGLGETPDEVLAVMDDLRGAGCDILTIGQYLAPSSQHLPVAEYVPPERFRWYRVKALRRGFRFVASAPFVRSSYHAGELVQAES